MFFVIDGVDGTGKATQTALLVERCKREGREVETISFPQYRTPSAALVEKYLAGEYGDLNAYQASVLFAADRFDASFRIRQAIEQGRIVIADRYVSSNMGHQGGKIADAKERSAYFAWNDNLEYAICGIPRPTLTIVLDLPATISQRLAQENASGKIKVAGDVHEKSLEHMENARAVYQEIATTFPQHTLISCLSDSGEILSRETIHELIWKEVRKVML